jgi:hypothetical protein
VSGSLHLHSGGECLEGDASFGEAGQINVFPVDLTMFPATVEDSHPFEGESPNRHMMAPGEPIAISGTRLGIPTTAATLQNTQVTFDGTPAYPVSVTTTQISATGRSASRAGRAVWFR